MRPGGSTTSGFPRRGEGRHNRASDQRSRTGRLVGRWGWSSSATTIDDGLRYDIPRTLRPLAYWAIDTHLDFARSLERARTADLVFAAQKEGAEALRQEGVAAEWLPLACDPDIHRRHELAKEYAWCFVGNLLPGERQRLVSLLRARSEGVRKWYESVRCGGS